MPGRARTPAADEAKQTGRGTIYIALAKMYFMVAGLIIEFQLPAILSNTLFGAYAVVAQKRAAPDRDG